MYNCTTYLQDLSCLRLLHNRSVPLHIGNARVFGFDESLGLHGNQFGNIITLSSVCTVVFEVPWVMSVKRCGARNAIGTAFVLRSACTIGTAFIHTYGQPIAVRMLLNAAEAGLAQGFAFLFSQIYPPTLAGKRIMTTNIAQCISGAFGGLFAYAFQTMGARNGLEAWRWLFIIEFLITVVICGVGLFFLPNTPEEAWFLNAEEKHTMQMKKERNFLLRGKDRFERRWIKSFRLPPRIVRGNQRICYASLKVNYMTIPVYVVGCISLIVQVCYSDKVKKRGVFIISCCVPVSVGYLICVGSSNPGAGYAGMFVLVLVTWITNNLSPDSKRAVGMPFAYSIANLSNLVSSQLYPSQQGPRYVQGNAVSAGLTVVAGFLYDACWVLLRRRNMKKAKLIAEGATNNGLEGDQSLDSMYVL
ncbi:unnamed protein product [Zymoseptoria tritici ST99CH_1A5]|uniref:Major facilitator superfamily (MFS) profile domain-containing protein n=1 Tax=Zymoseptoria tritici ST99CH_1A5 TaxID=1276529 RepID=A0A1Y6L4C4_ZYMTR|nr:unnamed protein product [Zymoseptoria tritici ST99CH_1A5]